MGGRLFYSCLFIALFRLCLLFFEPNSDASIQSEFVFKWPFLSSETYKGTRVVVDQQGSSIELLFSNYVTYSFGDTIRVSGDIKQCISKPHSAYFNYCQWLKLNGIDHQFIVKSHFLEKATQKLSFFLLFSKIPKLIFDRFVDLYPQNFAAIYAMIFGGRYDFLSSDLKQLFLETGLIHILVVSGAQITILIASFVIIFRLMRLPMNIGIIFIVFVQFVYLGIVGVDASILRAIIMADLFLINHYILLRRYPFYWYLFIAGFIVIIIDPNQLFLVGFWYSFLISWSLIVFIPRFIAGINGPKWFIGYVLASIIAVIIAIPIQLIYQSHINFIALISNLWLSWISGLFLFLGLFNFVMSFVSLSFSQLIGKYIDFLLDVMIQVMKALSEFSVIIRFDRWEVLCICIGYLLLCYCLIYQRHFFRLLIFQLLLIVIVFVNTSLRNIIIAIDVGQGDATLVISGQHSMLIDVGGINPQFKYTILPILNYYGINDINVLVITHHDLDHIGGLPDLLKYVRIGDIFSPKRLLLENHHIVNDQVQFSISGGDCLLSSPRLFSYSENSNNQSLILECEIHNSSFLITGDIDQLTEIAAIRANIIQKVDILKLGHHGSRYSNSSELFDVTQPRFVWNSSGKNNVFGHPHPSVLSMLNKRLIPFKSTHKDGAIVIKL